MKVKEICYSITDGSHNPPQGIEQSEFLMLSSKNIFDDEITIDDPRFLSEEDFQQEDKRTKIIPGDVLLTIVGTVGRTAVVSEQMPRFTLQRSVAVLHPNNDICLSRFLMYALRSKRTYIEKTAKGVAQKGIYLGEVGEIDLPIPTIEQQETVVDILDKVGLLIQAYQRQLSTFDQLIKARFVEMFGDPVSNPFGLPEKKLSELGTLDRGRSQRRPRNAPELLGGPYPLIQTGEVSSAGLYITEYHNTYSETGLKQSKMWKAGTLCITIAANIAQTAIMTFDACFPDSVVGFVPYNEVNALYVHYWFGFFQKILEEQAPQVAQKNINLKILSDLNVIVPERRMLKQFEDFVSRVDKSKLSIQASLDQLETLKQSLMQQYFG